MNELTDKTLPEELQIKILRVLTRFYADYAQLHSISSRKSGDITKIDVYLSFEAHTSFEEIVKLKKQMQAEFDNQIGNCMVDIVVGDN